MIIGTVLALFGGLLSIPLWYLDVVGSRAGTVIGVGVQVVGLVLIVVGAIRNSRGRRRLVLPPPPPPPSPITN